MPLLLVATVLFLNAAAQQSAPAATLSGTIRGHDGKPAAQAQLRLRKRDSPDIFTTNTDSQGTYKLLNLEAGSYSLEASKDELAATIDAVYLEPHESKTVDLTLEPQPGKLSPVSTPQFFDQPQFTIAGVTDTTNLGGHGSDTAVRARDTLAKDTALLGRPANKSSIDPGREQLLREDAKRTREMLASHDAADLHHALGDIEEQLGQSLEAVREYQRAAELDPSESHIFDWGAELLLHHAPEPAIEVFSKGRRLYPASARMLLGLGATFFARGSYDDAVREISQASDLNPNDPTPYIFLGKIAQAQGTPSADLVEKLHRFVTVQPHNPEAKYYYALGLWKLQKMQLDEPSVAAIESLLKSAIQIDPNCAPAALQLGIVHAGQGAYKTAISDFEHALQLDPQLEEAHYRLAQAYRQIGESEKAKEELRLYEQLTKESAAKQDRERRQIKQFVYTLRDPAVPAR